MTDRPDRIEFDLVQNAIDSLWYAIDLIAWEDGENEAQNLKNSIRSIAHAVELLLKERLRRIHPSLIWENVDRYPDISARTVGVDRAMSRLGKIGGITISAPDAALIRSLRNTRNAIEHFHWSTTRNEATAIVGKSLSFAIDFASEQLHLEIFGYNTRKDDTWQQLIENNHEFVKAHSRRHEERANTDCEHQLCCDFCGALAVDLNGGACNICGHWHHINDDSDGNGDIPF